jgi:glycosyltransferase involved in cell wall biosynthesis
MGLLKREGVPGNLRIAGSLGEELYVQHLQQIIREEGIGDRVILLGSLSRQDLLVELRAARCVVHPSFQENAPMAIAEAAAAGVPSVASAVGGIPEMVAHKVSGWLVDPGSPTSIADGLRALFADCELADTLGAMARQRAGVHRPRHVATELHSIYAKIAPRKTD